MLLIRWTQILWAREAASGVQNNESWMGVKLNKAFASAPEIRQSSDCDTSGGIILLSHENVCLLSQM